MAGNFQDDVREDDMRRLFGLYKDENEGRDGIDAHLEIDGISVPFELKTTSKGSVTTVRDFGPDHIEKWRDKHWLIGFFINNEEYYHYASPAMMAPWIKSREAYIEPDFMLADLAPANLTINDMHQILGEKDSYTYTDAKNLHKMQYKRERYLELQDTPNGYSPERMLNILKDRATYLIKRGSTLNNPKIPFRYFLGWEKITENHAEKLRELVRQELEQAES